MGVSGRDRVMFLNKKTHRNNIPHKKGQFPSTSKNWALSMERVDNMFSTRILSEGMEILRLGKSIQNPNHTKQGIGCQMYLRTMGRKPDDRSEDLRTWKQPDSEQSSDRNQKRHQGRV